MLLVQGAFLPHARSLQRELALAHGGRVHAAAVAAVRGLPGRRVGDRLPDLGRGRRIPDAPGLPAGLVHGHGGLHHEHSHQLLGQGRPHAPRTRHGTRHELGLPRAPRIHERHQVWNPHDRPYRVRRRPGLLPLQLRLAPVLHVHGRGDLADLVVHDLGQSRVVGLPARHRHRLLHDDHHPDDFRRPDARAPNLRRHRDLLGAAVPGR
mmetsp:Transcript_84787/g.258874  ORF Transcript_84787/g.258874 Transcript_84787/m.258874 type:complete len:208 (-) Transcript_84787:1387-2010(-)